MIGSAAMKGELIRWTKGTLLVFATTALAIAGCSDVSSGPQGQGDGGPDSEPPRVEPTEAQFNIFNNSPNLLPFRLCFKYGQAVLDLQPLPSDPEKPMPSSNYPGIGEGAVVPLPTISLADLLKDGGDRDGKIEAFAVRAKLVIDTPGADPKRCPDLVCSHGGCLDKGPDYVSLGQLSLNLGTPSALLVTGCPAGGLGAALDDTSVCGANYTPASGNLAARSTPLGTPVNEPNGAMLIKLLDVPTDGSRVTFGSKASSQTLTGGFVSHSLPGSLSSFATYGVTITPPTDGGVADASDGSVDASFDAMVDASGDAGSESAGLFFSLAAIQDLSDPLSQPNEFFVPGAYVFAILGSEAVGPAINPDGSRNAKPFAMRVVALRTRLGQ